MLLYGEAGEGLVPVGKVVLKKEREKEREREREKEEVGGHKQQKEMRRGEEEEEEGEEEEEKRNERNGTARVSGRETIDDEEKSAKPPNGFAFWREREKQGFR